jgi:hypothetical protein
MSFFDNPIFQDAEAAREWLEALLWPEGSICPHCGLVGAAYKMHNKSQRPGVYKCKGCEQQFTVTVGTVFERSHVPLNKWIFTFQLMAASYGRVEERCLGAPSLLIPAMSPGHSEIMSPGVPG